MTSTSTGTPKEQEVPEEWFESCPERAGTGCEKYDAWAAGVTPMCVADMDVRCCPAILDALAARVRDHGVLGYAHATPGLVQAAVGWLKRQHGWDVQPEWLVWFPGIVSGMNAFVRAVGLLHAGQGECSALVHVPAYPPFLSAPANQQQRLVKVPLRCDVGADGQQLRYEIDWDALERAVDPSCRCYILCNPHNPTGRQWTAAELRQLAAFCERHGLYVLSDEIWADLVLGERPHVPFATVVAGTPLERRVATMVAPSKTFNIAGLGCSVGIIPDPELRAAFKRASAGIVPGVNCLGLVAAEAAWGGACDAWHRGLLAHLRRNLALVEQTLRRCPRVRWSHPEATFVVWIDPRAAYPPGVDESSVVDWLAREHKIGLSNGSWFDQPGWLRMNIGCPTATLQSVLARFEQAFGSSKQ